MRSLRSLIREHFKNSTGIAEQLSANRHSSSRNNAGHKIYIADVKNCLKASTAMFKCHAILQCSPVAMVDLMNSLFSGVVESTRSLFHCRISPTNYLGIAESMVHPQLDSTAHYSVFTSSRMVEVEKSRLTEGLDGASNLCIIGMDSDGCSGTQTARGPAHKHYGVSFGTKCLEFLVPRSSSGSKLFSSCRSFSSKPLAEETVVIERMVSRNDVESFARLTGDTNPVHFSGKAIVHGALLNGFLSSVIGTKLPGPGTILVSQQFKFPHPCYIDDFITIQVWVADVRKISICRYEIRRKSDDKTLMEGEAKVIVMKDFGVETGR